MFFHKQVVRMMLILEIMACLLCPPAPNRIPAHTLLIRSIRKDRSVAVETVILVLKSLPFFSHRPRTEDEHSEVHPRTMSFRRNCILGSSKKLLFLPGAI